MFNNDGYLNPGFYDWSSEMIQDNLVNYFRPNNQRRKEVFQGYLALCNDLILLGISSIQWIGGSFVSAKAEPGDIDLSNIVSISCLDSLLENNLVTEDALKSMFFGDAYSKPKYKCDSYLIPKVPLDHPDYNYYKDRLHYWETLWSYDREKKPKGIVRRGILLEGRSLDDV